MGFVLFEKWHGIRKDIDPKTSPAALQDSKNLEVDREKSKLVLSNGLKDIVDFGVDTSAPGASQIDSMYEWQDVESQTDNLLIYDKKSTVSDRRLYWYKRTINDLANKYIKQFGFKYRSVKLDTLDFMPWRGGLRIGTGSSDYYHFPLLFAYYDRTGDDAMFGGIKSFSGNFPSVQQWVQKFELFGRALDIKIDPWHDQKIYLLTERGVEIRDKDGHIEEILTDVVAYEYEQEYWGGLAITDKYLYAVGEDPTSPGDFVIVAYNTNEGYSKIASVQYSSPLRLSDVWADNTNVYALRFDTTSGAEQLDVIEYANDLTGASTIYSNTAAGREPAFGITGDTNYVYVADNQIPGVLRVERTAPYGTSTLTFSGVGQLSKLDISKNADYLEVLDVQSSNTRIIEIATSTFSSYTVKKTENAKLVAIHCEPDGKYPNVFGEVIDVIDRKRNQIISYADRTFNSYNLHHKFTATVSATNSLTTQETFFYGFSIVDIWGQEYHLMTGMQVSCEPTKERNLRLYLHIVYETVSSEYGDATSSVITDVESAWDIFRRIKKIKVYRAYSSAKHAAWPFTDYRFLKEIDINADSWVEESADSRYYIDITDDIDEADLSTITYEETTGLPERFKPDYVRWKTAARFGNYFYFGNVYVDEQLPNTFVRSTYLSPDVCYLVDDNWVNTEIDGDSGIIGMYEYSNRLAVLKRNNLLLYNDLNFDLKINVGSYNREAFLPYGSRYFVINRNGLFIGNITGYKKISIPVDGYLASVDRYWLALDYNENKLIVFDGSKTLVYDLANGTWAEREYNYNDASGQLIDTSGFYQSLYGKFYLFENRLGHVYEKGGYLEAGNVGIDVILSTGYFKLSGSYSQMILKRLILNYYSTESFTLRIKYTYIDNSGTAVSSQYDITIPAETTDNMREFLLPEIYCNDFYVYIVNTFTDKFELRSIGFEYEVLRI